MYPTTRADGPRPRTCPRCGGEFFRNIRGGRPPTYCSSRCRSAAFRARRAVPQPTAYAHELSLIGQSVAARASLVSRAASLGQPAPPADPLRAGLALQRDLDDYLTIAVREALERGASWSDIAEVMPAGISSLKSRFSAARAAHVLRARRARRPGAPSLLTDEDQAVAVERAPAASAQDRAAERGALASALSHLHRRSGLPLRRLADKADLSASYVYRLLAAERFPSWTAVERIAKAADRTPADFLDLWHRAHGTTPAQPEKPPHEEALAAFQATVRGLHLAAGCPAADDVLDKVATCARWEEPLLTALLTTTTVPQAHLLREETVAALAAALCGDPARLKARWDTLQHAVPRPTVSAGAFG
ncbi:helix-turn-helix domain-containing protein [Streptomyces sp. NPDC087440]|uniref:helix-turn-helix domain-containing protein n=1 Tax=Streptomyces sp. NPDC087440 TaxID=3365790 RepID=UPI00380E5334